jgi:hypothetical protein
MKSDIRPLSNKDPDSPHFHPKKDFDQEKDQTKENEKQEKDRETVDDIRVKRPKDKTKKRLESKNRQEKKKFFSKRSKDKRRNQLENLDKQNNRRDLTFLWALIIIVIFGSLAVLAYQVFFTGQSKPAETNSQQVENEENENSQELSILSDELNYYYLAGDEDNVKIYQENIARASSEEILSFNPPPTIKDLDASWDNSHRFAYIDDEGVQIYNADKDTTFLLAPNRGKREYYKVVFANDDKIATLYKINNESYLEIYSSSLRLINKKIPANDFGWTKENLLSYMTVDHDNKNYQFKIYDSDKKDYQDYFKPFFSKQRYPLTFKNSKISDRTAFLLRDKEAKQSKIILSIGEHASNQLTKIGELLYLDNSVEDERILNPTIVWDKKEDHLYISINNQMFKVNLSTNEAEELDLGFSGTIQAISEDNKYLYIKKDESEDNIEKPESAVVYNLSEGKIENSSSLAQYVDFLNYNYWSNN